MNALTNLLPAEQNPQLISIKGGGKHTNFAASDVARLQAILSQFSENMLMDAKWDIRIASARRQTTISFPLLSREIDAILIRALVLQRLSYAGSTLGRAVKDAEWILRFFSGHQLHIENCRTSTVDLIVKELTNSVDLSVIQKNSIMVTLGSMVDLCEGFGLIAGTGIVDCSYRWKEKRMPKRAPDACVIEQLDSYFFDAALDIPLQYRTIYMLLRLISNRISEVLFMPIDCISYPDVDTYSISIPTQKETPYHIPEYKAYPKKLSGIEEAFLHRCICELQVYAESQQENLDCQYQNLLFVSESGKSILSSSDINSFFKIFCDNHQIKDASGNLACITTHDLRHTAVVERLNYGIISPYQTMRESNHSSLSQTLGYGYASVHDETERLAEISESLLNGNQLLPAKSDEGEPRELPPKKFLALKEDSTTRLLLDGSICLDRSCVPSFETCSDCDHFQVDSIYREPLENYIKILSERSQYLQKRAGNPDTIEFIEHQILVYTKMLDKIKDCAKLKERKVS